MKRYVIIFLLLSICSLAFAQVDNRLAMQADLHNNTYFLQSQELKVKANEAFAEGDYDAAMDYATQSQEYAILSDQFVEKMLQRDAANIALANADQDIENARLLKAETRYAEEWNSAMEKFNGAKQLFNEEEYVAAEEMALSIKVILSVVVPQAEYPEYVEAISLKKLNCLWSIAALPCVYNDASLWPKIYEANKDIMVDKNNPNLIKPGQKFRIPSLKGEERSGTYDENAEYSVFPKD